MDAPVGGPPPPPPQRGRTAAFYLAGCARHKAVIGSARNVIVTSAAIE